MNPNTDFLQRRAGIGCPMCPDSNENDLVVELPSGKVHLQNDADYRGYCILICKRHAVEIHDLSETERIQWIEDLARVSQVISEVCAPSKLNVSMLGNMVPHLHCHIMPRYPDDPEWGHPPQFRTVASRRPLSEADYEALRTRLREGLM